MSDERILAGVPPESWALLSPWTGTVAHLDDGFGRAICGTLRSSRWRDDMIPDVWEDLMAAGIPPCKRCRAIFARRVSDGED